MRFHRWRTNSSSECVYVNDMDRQSWEPVNVWSWVGAYEFNIIISCQVGNLAIGQLWKSLSFRGLQPYTTIASCYASRCTTIYQRLMLKGRSCRCWAAASASSARWNFRISKWLVPNWIWQPSQPTGATTGPFSLMPRLSSPTRAQPGGLAKGKANQAGSKNHKSMGPVKKDNPFSP